VRLSSKTTRLFHRLRRAPRGRKNCTDLGFCAREKFQVPRGERYELCRSVHAEANAIIHAARADMLDATLYLVGKEAADGSYVKDANACAMCKRMIINAGIHSVVIRDSKDDFRVIRVYDQWVLNDDSVSLQNGY
jgi:dCMP deaminase